MKTQPLKALFGIFLAGMLLLHGVMAWQARGLVRRGYPDFTIFYAAGKIIDQGLGRSLYDESTEARVEQQFAPTVDIRHGALPYMHPPFEALLFLPLTKFSYPAAFLLWDGLNLLILLALPFIVRPYVPGLAEIPLALCLLAALAMFPVFLALLQGQDTFALLLLLTLAWRELRRDAAVAAGCWLGLGLFRFHLVLPIVLVLLCRGGRRAALGFSSTALGLAAISVWLVGWHEAVAYPVYLWRLESNLGNGAIVPRVMPNLRGLMASLVPAADGRIGQLMVVVVSLAVLAFACWKWQSGGSGSRLDLGFSLLIVSSVVVSYHGFAHDLGLLFLPLLLVWGRWQERPDWHLSTHWALVLPPLVLWFSPLLMLLLFRYGRLNVLAPVLLLWMWGIGREISREQAREPRLAEVRPASESG